MSAGRQAGQRLPAWLHGRKHPCLPARPTLESMHARATAARPPQTGWKMLQGGGGGHSGLSKLPTQPTIRGFLSSPICASAMPMVKGPLSGRSRLGERSRPACAATAAATAACRGSSTCQAKAAGSGWRLLRCTRVAHLLPPLLLLLPLLLRRHAPQPCRSCMLPEQRPSATAPLLPRSSPRFRSPVATPHRTSTPHHSSPFPAPRLHPRPAPHRTCQLSSRLRSAGLLPRCAASVRRRSYSVMKACGTCRGGEPLASRRA